MDDQAITVQSLSDLSLDQTSPPVVCGSRELFFALIESRRLAAIR